MASSGESRLKQLEKLYTSVVGPNKESFSTESLLDLLLLLYDECNSPLLRREKNVADFLDIVKPVAARVRDLRLKRDDFDTLDVIGRGSFGEVAVVRMKVTNSVFAMKTLNKWEMLKRAETACYREERDVLVFGDKRWITKLHYAFQDNSNLYFVMDYYSGGDLLTLLSKCEDHLPEHMLKFYAAEIVLAIHSIHKIGYVHRDIKPDNVLIDKSGHVRLADFGSCLRIDKDGFVKCSVAVGTPDYISPEILQAMEDGKGRYGAECDWWSLGICMYELIYGETPFYAESLVETYGKIMDHKSKFQFPDDYEVSSSCKSLLSSLVCDSSERLGRRGIQDFQKHLFFEGIDWENIFECTPPYVPDVSSPTDVSNFDVDDLMEPKSNEFAPPPTHQAFTGHHLPFIGFTYTKESLISDCAEGSILHRAAPDGAPSTSSSIDATVLETKIETLQKEKSELQRKLEDALQSANGHTTLGRSPSFSSQDSSVSVLKKKVEDAELKLRNLAKDYADLQDAKKNSEMQKEELSSKLKELERSKKSLMQDKESGSQEIKGIKDKMSSLQKDLREAQTQRKVAMEEFSDLNDKLAEVRSQKLKLTRLVREKEEEIENTMSKLDKSRQDLRTSDKKKRELITQVEELQADVHKESKLKLKSEDNVRRLEAELQEVAKKSSSSPRKMSFDQDVSKLKSEMEKLKVSHEENLGQERKKYAVEIKVLQEKVVEFENSNSSLESEVQSLKERLNRKVRDNTEEQDVAFQDFRTATLRNKDVLEKENRKLSSELEKLTSQLDKSIETQKKLEEELRDVSEKREAVSHWEEQITEIIQWVSDEKDARGYLQALATKMSEELENLKVSGMAGGSAAAGKNWQTRRSQRLDKQELLSLQANLKMEVQAKQHLSDEVNKIKAKFNQSERQNQDLEAQMKKLRDEVSTLRKENEKLKVSGGNDFSFSFLSSDFNEFLSNDSSLISPGKIIEEEESDTNSIVSSVPSSRGATDNYHVSVSSSISTSPEKPARAPSVSSATGANNVGVDASVKGHQAVAASPEMNQQKIHRFFPKTFLSPTKCHLCMSIMVGNARQGLTCDVCGYYCHMKCMSDAPKTCPVPKQLLSSRPLGIDPKKGTGTAHESFVRIPKPGGVKKGWMRSYAVVCDFKIIFYDTSGEKQPTNGILQVLDMRDDEFSVSSVLHSDVIHASKRDIPQIFKVIVAEMNPPGVQCTQLILCDNENERHKWVAMLQELHQIYIKTHGSQNKNVFLAKEVADNSLQIVKSTICAAIIGPEKIVVGTEEGLYCIELIKETVTRIGDNRKVYQVEMIAEEQLLVVLSGRGRHVRLYPLSVVDGHDIEPIKIGDSKGCLFFTTGTIRQGSCTCLCIATKKNGILYELNRTKTRFRKMRDFQFGWSCQWIGIYSDHLFIGYPSGFAAMDILKESPLKTMVNADEDKSLAFLAGLHLEALLAVEVNENEYLLCFRDVAFFVDERGCRTKQVEMIWPSPVLHLAYMSPYLLAYTERGIDIFKAATGAWVQSVPIRHSRPLSRDGTLSIITTLDEQSIFYMKSDKKDEGELIIKSNQGKKAIGAILRMRQNKRRFSFKTRESMKAEEADLMSKLISGPSSFTHISHIGPGDGLPILKDFVQGDQVGRGQTRGRNAPIGAVKQGGSSSRPNSSYQAMSPTSDGSIRERSRSMEFNQQAPDGRVDADALSSGSTTSSASGRSPPFHGSSQEEIR